MVNDTVIRNFFYTSTPEHEGVLFHIPSGRFFRVFDEKCKSDFRQIFEIGSLSEDVLEMLHKIDSGKGVCSGSCENCDNQIKSANEFTVRKLALVLTSSCNMRCRYCYANYGMYDYEKAADMNAEKLESVLSYFTKNFKGMANGAIISRITGDTKQIVDLIIKEVLPDVIAVLKLIFSFVIMIKISWKLTIITIITLPILMLYYSKNSKTVRQKQSEVRNANDHIISSIQQAIAGIVNVKMLGLKNIERELFRINNEEKCKKEFDFSVFVVIFQTIISLMGLISEVTVFAVGGYFVLTAYLTAESFIQYTSYSQQFSNASLTLVGLVTDYQRIIVSIRRLNEIEETLNGQHERFGKNVTINEKGNIELCDVTFGYGEKSVLRNINLEIKENSVTALVGHSGCGKSTIIKLISGLYAVNNGKIFIHGEDLSKLSEECLRRTVSVVSQEHFFINASIIDNFRYVKNGITENEVRDLCELCGLDDMIGSLPEGYDTVIGENGSNFSVGQLQRLSIARVLAKNTPIVIFDEPTSSLDLENTEKVLNIINVIKKNKTVLVVSHDENIMECADQVINMNDF